MKNIWQLQDAKNRLSQLVEEAIQHGPQTITRRGLPTVMVISIHDYRQSTAHEGSLVDFFMRSPLHCSDLEFERDKDIGRDIDL